MYQDHHASFAHHRSRNGFMPAIAGLPLAAMPLRIGMLGLGTVGAGTYTVLQRNADVIAARTGRRMEITMVAVRNLARAASLVGDDVDLVDDPFAVVNHPAIDVIVEVIGGTTLARDLILQAIANGKHVVTANKALLAEHGSEIFAAARAQGVVVAYEGAVAVSIPIIKALREGLTANRIEWIAGIINGTTNYILSEMKDKGASFASALAQAQNLGYAEADPAFDVQGIDAAHKLTLLAANAFGVPVQFDKVHVEGISQLDSADVDYAQRLGYCVKLLGIAKRHQNHSMELRVHPTLVPTQHLLAQVHGSMNAVMVKSDAAGVTMYYGAGAGSEQTASAVIADLVDLARCTDTAPSQRVPYLAFQHHAVRDLPAVPIETVVTRFYLRLDVARLTRTLPRVLQLFAKAEVPVTQLDVFDHPNDEELSAVVVLTELLQESMLLPLLAELEALPEVMGFVKRIRLEALAG